MICAFCQHLLPIPPGLPQGMEEGMGYAATNVDCQHCRSRYEVGIRLISKPTITPAQLERIKNKPA